MKNIKVKSRPGHPWIFANEIIDPPVAKLTPGEAVRVFDTEGRTIGNGYANPQSLITIRIVGIDVDIDDPKFYETRIQRALDLRTHLLPDRRSYRLCAGESDGLPGIIIDRYEDTYSIQITTLGMDQRQELIKNAMINVLQPRAIVLRNDVGLRTLEGLNLHREVWMGELAKRTRFEENGSIFETDVLEGQKTGFFFDQAENRAWIAPRCKGAKVLDVYAYVGALAIQAAKAGALEVTAIDASEPACRMIERNAVLNGVNVTAIAADARETMEKMINQGQRYDIVSIDPPAFAKSRKTAAAALAGYRTINMLAIKLVRPGGILLSSSCSHHIQAERFEETIREAAWKVRKEIVLIRKGGQAPDHPILLGVPETEYLKHLVFIVR